MEKTNRLYHPELGQIKVLLEYSSKRNFKLVKAFYRVDFDYYGTRRFFMSNKPSHYILWGNQDNLDTMGVTELLTPTSRRPSYKSCIQKFHKMVKDSDLVNFIK